MKEGKRTYYVAYGSNLNIGQMRERCEGATPIGSGYLQNWELFYAGSKTGNYASIRQKKGCIVPVGIWLVDKENVRCLDRYEGYPVFYYKRQVLVHMPERPHNIYGLVYIMSPERIEGRPSPHYIDVCRRGYRDFGLDEKYLDESLRNAGIKHPENGFWRF